MDKKKILNYALDIGLIIIVVVFIVQYNKNRDQGMYDFCVQWNYDTYREDLLWKCYDFRNENILCEWYVDTNNILVIYNPYNTSDYMSYPCTKLTKSINIEIDIPKPEEMDVI